jgi:hypothetical protein
MISRIYNIKTMPILRYASMSNVYLISGKEKVTIIS